MKSKAFWCFLVFVFNLQYTLDTYWPGNASIWQLKDVRELQQGHAELKFWNQPISCGNWFPTLHLFQNASTFIPVFLQHHNYLWCVNGLQYNFCPRLKSVKCMLNSCISNLSDMTYNFDIPLLGLLFWHEILNHNHAGSSDWKAWTRSL